MKKILIDGFWCSKPRGLGKYIRTLLRSLIEGSNDGSLLIYLAIPKNCEPPEFLEGSPIHILRGPNFPYPIWEQIVIPRFCRAEGIDVLHSPCNTYPLYCFGVRQVVTLHDLIFMQQLGENWYQRLGNMYRYMLAKLMRFKKKLDVLTVSSASGRVIEEKIAIGSKVVYTPIESSKPIDSLRISVESHLLHIGGITPHKNTRKVIDAYRASGVGLRLIVLGVPKESELALSYLGHSDVIFPGWISDDEVSKFLENAQFLIFPSLAEGFGLPIIEAFAARTPVITSNLDPMREISGGAALLIDPRSTHELRTAISELASDPARRDSLRRLGDLRLNQFSRGTFAAEMRKFYLKSV